MTSVFVKRTVRALMRKFVALSRSTDLPHLRSGAIAAARLERELERQGEKRAQRRRFYDSSMILACYEQQPRRV